MYVIQKSSMVIVDTKADRDYFAQEFFSDKDKFEVLYLKADVSIYSPDKFPVKKKKKNHLDVLYFGSILPLQGVEVILEAMQQLKNEHRIHFVIVGPIGKQKVNKEDYPNTQFYEWLAQEKLAEKISQSDLCLAGHFSDSIGKADRTIAGKTYIYKAMGKPIVLGDSKANRELFEANEMNYYVKRGDAHALAEKLRELV